MRTSRLVIVGVLLACVLMCVGVSAIAAALVLPLNLPLLNQALGTRSADSSALPVPAGAPRVGQAAPGFTLRGLDQKNVQLGQFRGKPVMLNFWATWCAPCSAEMPNIEKAYEQHSDGDVVILAVNQNESAEQVSGYADLYRLHFPILLDDHGEVGNKYRVQALPTTIFIDRTGTIREIHIGGPMTPDFIQARLDNLLKSTP